MLELTGIASVLRGIGFIYWLLAIGLLIMALWNGKGWIGKTLWALPVVCLFGYLPITGYIEQSKRQAFAKEAWAYFKNKCDTLSGEKIYKRFTGVKSVLVTKPLPPAEGKDLYDQFWYGDPYSAPADSQRGKLEAGRLLVESMRLTTPPKKQQGFRFVEIALGASEANRYQRLTLSIKSDRIERLAEDIQLPESRFGVAWDDISKPEDRKYWVAGSRLKIVDLVDNSVVAERVGYLIEGGFGAGGQRRPWLAGRGPQSTCPPLVSGDYEDQWFITSVLTPSEEK